MQKAAVLNTAFAFQSTLPAWARSGLANDNRGIKALQGTHFDLEVARTTQIIDGKKAAAVLINGQLPAPLLRWREGSEVTLSVTNRLKEDTSIHWHGLLLPYRMDGVPGVSFTGIKPGKTFVYKFPLMQAGTYWYHSHSGFQEQQGHYGPIVIEAEHENITYDREYVIVLSDWTPEDPHRLFAKLKKMGDYYNFQQRTLGDFFKEVKKEGLQKTLAERMMWGEMRMNQVDIADVTAATYTYLLNGHSPADNWTGLFKRGERLRLRYINASAMSIFNVRIPGLPMTVVQADGLDVQPLETDEFQIGTAETYDVVVTPEKEQAYALVCESNDSSGMAFGTLSPRMGMVAEQPALRSRPLLTMKDMAMDDHAGHSMMMHGDTDVPDLHAGHEMMMQNEGEKQNPHAGHNMMMSGDTDAQDLHAGDEMMMQNEDEKQNPHAGHNMMMQGEGSMPGQLHRHRRGVGVDAVAQRPVNRLAERPLGLEDQPHRVLVYADLKSLHKNPDSRPPERELELHLTGNMERYMWSFDGIKFSEVRGPIVFRKGERLRLTLVNDTMMPHPIHLHGMFFDLVTGDHQYKPRKHTVVVKPGERLSADISADAVGDWAFHCHLLYHMMAGMMRVVSVRDEENV